MVGFITITSLPLTVSGQVRVAGPNDEDGVQSLVFLCRHPSPLTVRYPPRRNASQGAGSGSHRSLFLPDVSAWLPWLVTSFEGGVAVEVDVCTPPLFDSACWDLRAVSALQTLLLVIGRMAADSRLELKVTDVKASLDERFEAVILELLALLRSARRHTDADLVARDDERLEAFASMNRVPDTLCLQSFLEANSGRLGRWKAQGFCAKNSVSGRSREHYHSDPPKPCLIAISSKEGGCCPGAPAFEVEVSGATVVLASAAGRDGPTRGAPRALTDDGEHLLRTITSQLTDQSISRKRW